MVTTRGLLAPELLLAVALGGAAGSLARYLVLVVGPRTAFSIPGFPWWTLVINVTGSFVLAFFARYFLKSSVPPSLYLAVTAGLCGGFTTFSTFSYELLDLGERGQWYRAAVYAGSSVMLGLAAVVAGASLARTFRP